MTARTCTCPSLILWNLTLATALCAFLSAFSSCPRVAAAVTAAAPPHIAYVFPAGGRQGTSFEAVLGGQSVNLATSAQVTGTGVEVVVADVKDLGEDKGKGNQKKRKTVINGSVKLKVVISADAEPGARELRLITKTGISNPLVFHVGQLPEVAEVEPNERKEGATKITTVPTLINGRIMPGDVDWFRFPAKKGQRIVAELSARSLIPYLADAVPGWFQGTITLLDAQGKELAFVDDYKCAPDPVLIFEAPEDGDYLIEVRDAIYRGRDDFVYRLALGERPFITSVFPLGGRRGKTVLTKITGVNLPQDTMEIALRDDTPSLKSVSLTKNGVQSNSVPFAVGDLPEVAEYGSNTDAPHALKVELPTIVNGRLLAPGETRFYSFEGRKGQSVAVDVSARRLGSPLDSKLAILNCRGELVKENDDQKDPGEGLITHQADSGLTVELPEDGTYTVALGETQGKGGPEYAYRLKIAAPSPDFELRVVPSSLTIPQGGSAALTVHVLRRDGFNDAVTLALQDENAGLSLVGTTVPEKMDKIRLTVSASPQTAVGLASLKITGTSVIDGKAIIRPAVPADDCMQAFIYRHLVPATTLAALIVEPAPFTISYSIPKQGFLELPCGKETSLPLTVLRHPGYDGPIQLQLIEPPQGITLRRVFVPMDKKKSHLILRAESKTASGIVENLILTGTIAIETGEANAKGKKMRDKIVVTAPALPVKTVPTPAGKKD